MHQHLVCRCRMGMQLAVASWRLASCAWSLYVYPLGNNSRGGCNSGGNQQDKEPLSDTKLYSFSGSSPVCVAASKPAKTPAKLASGGLQDFPHGAFKLALDLAVGQEHPMHDATFCTPPTANARQIQVSESLLLFGRTDSTTSCVDGDVDEGRQDLLAGTDTG